MKAAFSLLAAIGLLAAARPTPAQSHDQSHAAGVRERGDHVMGFDHAKTTHHFRLARTGGSIEVETRDAADTESRDQIRTHLEHIAKMFSEGDFDAPMLIHGRVPPGVGEMKKRKADIRYEFEELPRGGRIRIATKNARARSAVHEFLRFQIRDHGTGDPMEVAADK